MHKVEDKDTRYYVDLDLKDMKILNWGYDRKQVLVHEQELDNPDHRRIFITKGQYNKLTR